jgi:hypothetical protein
MADLDFLERSAPVQIVGGDEQFPADVILERGQKKLLVKSTSAPQILGNISFDYATRQSDSSINLNVNGSATPQDFMIMAKPFDLVVNSLVFECFAGNVRTDRFLDLNAELTNGILVTVKSENNEFSFNPIRRTGELDSLFAVGDFSDFKIIAASSGTYVSAKFGLSSPFIIRASGTYAIDDFIRVRVRDNLSAISRIRFLSIGALDV